MKHREKPKKIAITFSRFGAPPPGEDLKPEKKCYLPRGRKYPKAIVWSRLPLLVACFVIPNKIKSEKNLVANKNLSIPPGMWASTLREDRFL